MPSSPRSVVGDRALGRAVHLLSRPQHPVAARSRTPHGAFSLPRFLRPPVHRQRSGASAASPATRCGVAWNTLLLAALLRGRLHGAGPRLRADRHAHRLPLQEAAARALGAADHHAAVRDRTRPDPDLRPRGPRQPLARMGVRHHARRAGSTACQGVLLAQIFSFTPIAFLVLIGVVEGVSPSIEEAAQTLRANRWRDVHRRLAAADAARTRQRIPGQLHRIDRRLRQSDRARRQLRRAVDRGLLLRRRRAARPGPRRDARHPAAAVRARRVLRCSAACSAARSTRRSPARATAGLPTPLPDGVRRALLCGRAAVGAADDRHLRDGARRRLRRALGPRLHADAARTTPRRSPSSARSHGILWTGTAWNSFWTTVKLSAIAAPVTAALGILTAYLLTRHRFAGRAAFEFGTMLSFAIPGTVIGVSYILAFNVPPIEITGTALILSCATSSATCRSACAPAWRRWRRSTAASTRRRRRCGARGLHDAAPRAAAAAQARGRRRAGLQLRARGDDGVGGRSSSSRPSTNGRRRTSSIA